MSSGSCGKRFEAIIAIEAVVHRAPVQKVLRKLLLLSLLFLFLLLLLLLLCLFCCFCFCFYYYCYFCCCGHCCLDANVIENIKAVLSWNSSQTEWTNNISLFDRHFDLQFIPLHSSRRISALIFEIYVQLTSIQHQRSFNQSFLF